MAFFLHSSPGTKSQIRSGAGRCSAALLAAALVIPLSTATVMSAAAAVPGEVAQSGPVLPLRDGSQNAKVRTVITTDPELDDENSLVRWLLYSNEVDIEGLVYSSSQHHYIGDPANGVDPFRWPAAGDVLHIDEAVNAYEKVYPNLKTHDSAFPTPADLRSKIKWGNVKTKGDMAEDTEGSELIKNLLLDDDDSKIYLQAWGGHNTIARALKSIQDEFGTTDQWAAIQEKITAKAVITSFGFQDSTFVDYIRPNWPNIELREVSTNIWGYFARNSADAADAKYLSPEWTRANVLDKGALGAAYRAWGNGRQMAPNDDEDYFWLSGYTSQQLLDMGYQVWTPPQPKDAWISEGDSSNFALLVDNGLRNYEDPTYGGWGGRQKVNATDPHRWANSGVQDVGPAGTLKNDWAAARWFEDFQLDFAARLQWSTSRGYSTVNHEPTALAKSGLEMNVRPGDTIPIAAEATDSDGNAVTVKWWQYKEADTYPGSVSIADAASARTTVSVPADAVPGDTVHVILEVQDNGTPSLTSYQRVILTVVDQYTPAVVADSASSVATSGGGTVTLTGSDLFDVSSVSVGGATVEDFSIAADGRSLTFEAPESEARGEVSVVLASPGGEIETALTYVGPEIASASPQRIRSGIDSNVTITGSGFTGATDVKFDGLSAQSFSVNADGTSIRASVPTKLNGSVAVTVVLPGADAVLADAVTFVSATATFTDATIAKERVSYGTSTSITVKVVGGFDVPAGEVKLYDRSTLLGTAQLDAAGRAKLTVPASLTVGNHALIAKFTPTDTITFDPSVSDPAILTVVKATATVTAKFADSTITKDRKAVLKVAVTSGSRAVTGTVTVLDGKKKLTSAKLHTSADGKVTFTLPKLKKGVHTITVKYSGSTTLLANTTTKKLTVR